MNVRDLIAYLRELPPEANVYIHHDGAPSGSVGAAWLCKNGIVALGPLYESVDDDRFRASGSPTMADRPELSVGEMLSLIPRHANDEESCDLTPSGMQSASAG